jgi:hypothetical protein
MSKASLFRPLASHPQGQGRRLSSDGRRDAEVYEKYADELIRFATGLVGPTEHLAFCPPGLSSGGAPCARAEARLTV